MKVEITLNLEDHWFHAKRLSFAMEYIARDKHVTLFEQHNLERGYRVVKAPNRHGDLVPWASFTMIGGAMLRWRAPINKIHIYAEGPRADVPWWILGRALDLMISGPEVEQEWRDLKACMDVRYLEAETPDLAPWEPEAGEDFGFDMDGFFQDRARCYALIDNTPELEYFHKAGRRPAQHADPYPNVTDPF